MPLTFKTLNGKDAISAEVSDHHPIIESPFLSWNIMVQGRATNFAGGFSNNGFNKDEDAPSYQARLDTIAKVAEEIVRNKVTQILCFQEVPNPPKAFIDAINKRLPPHFTADAKFFNQNGTKAFGQLIVFNTQIFDGENVTSKPSTVQLISQAAQLSQSTFLKDGLQVVELRHKTLPAKDPNKITTIGNIHRPFKFGELPNAQAEMQVLLNAGVVVMGDFNIRTPDLKLIMEAAAIPKEDNNIVYNAKAPNQRTTNIVDAILMPNGTARLIQRLQAPAAASSSGPHVAHSVVSAPPSSASSSRAVAMPYVDDDVDPKSISADIDPVEMALKEARKAVAGRLYPFSNLKNQQDAEGLIEVHFKTEVEAKAFAEYLWQDWNITNGPSSTALVPKTSKWMVRLNPKEYEDASEFLKGNAVDAYMPSSVASLPSASASRYLPSFNAGASSSTSSASSSSSLSVVSGSSSSASSSNAAALPSAAAIAPHPMAAVVPPVVAAPVPVAQPPAASAVSAAIQLPPSATLVPARQGKAAAAKPAPTAAERRKARRL